MDGLSYRIEGSGRPLLLVHGFGISFNIWKELLPLLRHQFTLVMVELPGLGTSLMPAGDETYLNAAVEGIECVRLALGLETWDVLGYSTGSRIAEAYVQKYARSVGQAVFLCPMALDVFKVTGLRFAFWADNFFPAMGSWLLRGPRLKFFISLFGFNLQPDPHTGEWYEAIGVLPVRVLKETLRMLTLAGTRPFAVPAPFSIIWGDEDIIPAMPRRRGPRDYLIHANHAAPVVAAPQVAGALLSIFKREQGG